MMRSFAVALAAATLSMSVAQAQQSSRPAAQDQAALQQACAGDFLRLCPGVDPASSAVEACFERNAAQLSPPCGQAIQTYKQRAKAN